MAPRYGLGVTLGLMAGISLSTGGVALRFVESANGWQILVYRAAAFSLMMAVVLLVSYRCQTWRKCVAVGGRGLVIASLLGGGAIAYIFAMLHTSVANVVVVLSTSPLLTAVSAQLFLGERCTRATWVAMWVVVVGIGIMFADGLQAGGLVGLFIALLAAMTYAGMLVLMRSRPDVDMIPATALSGPVTLLLALLMVTDLGVSSRDAWIGVFLGTFQFGLGFLLITLAARHIVAAQVALLSLSEVVLAPLWVWLAVGELPTTLGIVGGFVVILAVLAEARRALVAATH